jgi:GH15 family glucan-1,4-alpha-glucosidase
MVKKIVNYVCKIWNTPDSGIWEVRGGPRHFVYSKVMCWCAIDRGIRLADKFKFEAPRDSWNKTADDIRKAVISKGFNARLNSFVQTFEDTDTLDASSSLIPIMGFLPANDEKVLGTLDATLKYLSGKNGLIYRYKMNDGLAGDEGCFLLCSFWLIKALALAGRTEQAENLFNQALSYISPLGLFSEEIDAKTGQQLGNFPQAFSHIGIINAGLYLGIAAKRPHKGPKPMGSSTDTVSGSKLPAGVG